MSEMSTTGRQVPDSTPAGSGRDRAITRFDAVVVGAGFAGLYMLHRLRGLGLIRSWSCLAACFAIWSAGIEPSLAAPAMPAPEQAGTYRVGFITFPGTVGAGLPTKITVWYPSCRAVEADCAAAAPGSLTYPLTIFSAPNPQVVVSSPLGAQENAPAASGRFPLVVDLHGGPAFGPFRERSQLRDRGLLEHLASHGFVAAAFERNNAGSCANELAGPRDVVDTLIARSTQVGDLLHGRVDGTRVGVLATSAGGDAAYSMLTGADPSPALPQGIAPDARAKALMVTEAAHTGCGITTARKQSVVKPYLVMGGSPEFYDINVAQPFAELINAAPRILVKAQTESEDAGLNAEHVSYNVGDCETTDAVREESLRRQQASGQAPLIEPLTSRFGSDPRIADAGARVLAAEARRLWDNAVNLFVRQKTFCHRVGTDPAGILPLGVASSDGLVTASPPFEASPLIASNPPFTACSPVRCITGERMDRLVKLFTTSFLKTYLKGDKRYNRFLTAGYANQEPEAAVVRIGDEGG